MDLQAVTMEDVAFKVVPFNDVNDSFKCCSDAAVQIPEPTPHPQACDAHSKQILGCKVSK